MARKTNRSRYAILGLLSTGPKSGYDIKSLFNRTLRHFWNESYGQIYPMLSKLEKEELATCAEQESANGGFKKVYSITEAGMACFQQWLMELCAPEIGRNEFLLKLYFSWHNSDQQVLTQIQAHREDCQLILYFMQDRRAELEQKFVGQKELFCFVALTDYAIATYGALVKWCDDMIIKLTQRIESI